MSRRAPIDGVLIEGVDFIGKTTVSRMVADRLEAEGRPSALRQCYMSGAPLVRFLDEEAKSYDSMLERDRFYSAAILLDMLLAEPLPTFLVQDRHWLSQVGRNRFFHPDEELVRDGLIEAMHVPFAHNVLLTSSLDAKRERAAGRPVKSPRDRYLREHPQVHQEYEEFLAGLLPDDEGWVVVDTTGLAPDEVAEAILAHLA